MPTILLINDDIPLRTALKRALRFAGFEVLEAGHGREGLIHLAAHPVHLVLTDILMPEMEGVETILHLRRQRPDLRIIAMSGGSRFDAGVCLQLAKSSGADTTLAKPFSTSDMLEAVAAMLPEPVTSPAERL